MRSSSTHHNKNSGKAFFSFANVNSENEDNVRAKPISKLHSPHQLILWHPPSITPPPTLYIFLVPGALDPTTPPRKPEKEGLHRHGRYSGSRRDLHCDAITHNSRVTSTTAPSVYRHLCCRVVAVRAINMFISVSQQNQHSKSPHYSSLLVTALLLSAMSMSPCTASSSRSSPPTSLPATHASTMMVTIHRAQG